MSIEFIPCPKEWLFLPVSDLLVSITYILSTSISFILLLSASNLAEYIIILTYLQRFNKHVICTVIFKVFPVTPIISPLYPSCSRTSRVALRPLILGIEESMKMARIFGHLHHTQCLHTISCLIKLTTSGLQQLTEHASGGNRVVYH